MRTSKGGITMERAERMTRREVRDLTLVLSQFEGCEVEWETGRVLPPKPPQETAKRFAR